MFLRAKIAVLHPARGGLVITLFFLAGCQRQPEAMPPSPPAAESSPSPLSAPPWRQAPAPNRLALDARQNIEPIIGRLSEVGDTKERSALAREAIRLESGKTLEILASQLSGLAPSLGRDALLQETLIKLVASGPLDALGLAVKIKPEASARTIARQVANAAAALDFRGVYGFARSLPPGAVRHQIEIAAVRAGSDSDVQGAFDLLAGLAFDEGGSMIGIPSKQLALRNVEEAFQALDTIADPRVWDTAAGRIFEVVARNDRQEGIKLLFEQTDSKVAAPLAYALGTVFADRSVPEGVVVLNRIENNSVANQFVHGMIQRLNKGNMEPLLSNVPLIENPEIRRIAAGSVARDLALQNPARAASWVASLDDAKARNQAFQGAASGYADNDPAAAQLWLESLSPGEELRYAIFGFAMQYYQKDPAVAAAWAARISKQDVQARLLRPILSHWTTLDARAASAWAGSTGHKDLLPKK